FPRFPTKRFELWATAILGTVWLSIGCNPATLNYLLMPFAPDKEPPKCALAVKGKEVQVAVLCNFAKLETRTEILPAETELADKLAQCIKDRCKENKEKVSIIPNARVRSAMNQGGQAVSAQEIGKQVKADYVISLEINHMQLY